MDNNENVDEIGRNAPQLINDILMYDTSIQRSIRTAWPASWLQIHLPVGATRALVLIDTGNAITPRQVADQLGVGRTNVTGLLDKLETEGLISREIDRQDRRSFILRLTAKGRELVHQIDEIRQVQLSSALARIDYTALAALHQGLAALTEAIKMVKEQAVPSPQPAQA